MQKTERVTDEMVGAALAKAPKFWREVRDSARHMRAALTAAISSAEEKAVEVKKLEWSLSYSSDDENAWTASAIGGVYTIRQFTSGGGAWLHYERAEKRYTSILEAKAAAQQDYETRIRSALVDVPAVESEPVAWLRPCRITYLSGEERDGHVVTNKNDDRSFPVYAHPPRSSLIQSDEGWMPIETAPKDGTRVIIAVPTKDRDDWIVGEASFDPEHYEGGDWWWANLDYSDYHAGPISDCNHHAPEFWRPLPTPLTLSRKTAAPGDGSAISTKGFADGR